jgi:hypothetical protein
MVSCIPLEMKQPLSGTFFYLMLNKGVILSDQDKWNTLYMTGNLKLRTSLEVEICM